VDDEIDGVAVVEDIEPVANLATLAVDRDGLVLDTIGDAKGNKFFGELVGAVVVAGVADGNGKVVGAVICADEVIGSGFGSRVGTGGIVGSGFGELGWRIELEAAKNFVGADVMEADVFGFGGFEENKGAGDVGVDKNLRIGDGTVDVGFGGEMDDKIDVLGGLIDDVAVTDVAFDKGVVGAILN